ncbi:MAG: hypothetical protein ACQEVA_16610 [Myxococcota bacterium]
MHDTSTPPTPNLVCGVLCIVLMSLTFPGCETTRQAGDDSLSNQMLGDAPRSKATDDTPKKRGVLWYRLALDAPQDRLDVHVRLVGPPPRTTFFLPGPWAGRDDFARDVSINGARSDDGPVSFTISRSEGRIDVDSKSAKWIELEYSVQLHSSLSTDARFRPQLDEQMLFVYAPAILVLPSEGLTRQVRDIPIEVHLPNDWRTLTTWPNVRERRSSADEHTTVHGYVAADPTQLRDAYLAASPNLEIEHAQLSDGSALEVGFAPGFESPHDGLAATLAEIIGAYVSDYGSVGDVHVLARQLAEGSARHSRGVGRRGGFVLELPGGSSISDHELLIAHEALHLWNGHLLTPTPDLEPQVRWFKEGVTHYIALKTLNARGMMTTDQVLEELEQSARFYARNPAARARIATITDRARLPYDRGVLLALAIDALLMKHSAGDVDIRDWLQTLLDTMGRRDQDYAPDDLRRALVQIAGPGDDAVDRFWDDSIASEIALEPVDVFELAGLHWLRRGHGKSGRLLPLQRSDTPFRALFPGGEQSPSQGSAP